AILMFATNLGADRILDRLGDRGFGLAPEEVDHACRTELARHSLAPELLGRIGRFLVFTPLTDQALAEIAYAAVERAAAEYGLVITEVTPAALRAVLDQVRGTGL